MNSTSVVQCNKAYVVVTACACSGGGVTVMAVYVAGEAYHLKTEDVTDAYRVTAGECFSGSNVAAD